MIHFIKRISLFLIVLTLFSCNQEQKVSIEEETAKIMDLHNAQRTYHFEKDSINFANQMAKNFISVNKGIISSPTKASNIARYNRYFSSVEFIKWDDVSPPIIKFSDDLSMAYTIVDKIITISYEDENEGTKIEETHFAWTTIYKKYGGAWKIDCVTSTNKPVSEN